MSITEKDSECEERDYPSQLPSAGVAGVVC